ncbi:MAG: DUF1501 domain-containing protein [Nakamurella sp.]
MHTITRRQFLVASGTAGVAAAVAGTGLISWRTLADRAATDPLPTGTRILVIVTLYGGNDGLNTIVPYQDSAYHEARADFGYTADQVLRLDDSLGLNPAMKGTAGLWSAGQLAVVRGVGYPQPDRSHFRSMDIWQTASPAAPVNTGWIGRWLDNTGDDPVRAVNIGSVLPPLAVGAKGAAAALSLGGRDLPSQLASAITGLGVSDPGDTPEQVSVATSYCSERTVAATFAPVLSAGGSADPDPDESVPAASGGAHSNLQQQFDLVARCIKAGVPTTVYTVSLGGFDTHADEKSTQENQLGILDAAMSGFLTDLATDQYGRNVVVMAYSEFGRRVQANASQGTDHGTAGPVLIAGVPVRGGFYGEQPSLTDLDDGDLKATVDFRTVYQELVGGVLGADPGLVVPDAPTVQQLGFLV